MTRSIQRFNEAVTSSPTILLVGAGASAPLGFATTKGARALLERELEEPERTKLRDLYKAADRRYRVGEDWINIEYLLEIVNEMRLGCWLLAHNQIPRSMHAAAENLEFDKLMDMEAELRKTWEKVLYVLYRHYGKVDGTKALRYWGWLLTRLGGERSILPVFTTNYDWVFEELAIASGDSMHLIDGFSGLRGGEWSRQHFDNFVPSENLDLCLFKLHGSTSWYRAEQAMVKSLGPVGSLGAVIVNPGHRRDISLGDEYWHLEGLEDSIYLPWHRAGPFDCLYDYFSACLANARLLVSIGYAFGYDEINPRVLEALENNSDLHIVIMLPEEEKDPLLSRFRHIDEIVFQGEYSNRIHHVDGYFGNASDNDILLKTVESLLA